MTHGGWTVLCLGQASEYTQVHPQRTLCALDLVQQALDIRAVERFGF